MRAAEDVVGFVAAKPTNKLLSGNVWKLWRLNT
jgi:hypothetical protein